MKMNKNLWNTAKAVLRGKFIATSAYIKRTERSQINIPMLYLKLLEKQEQAKPKSNRMRKVIKIMAEINETRTKNTTKRVNETKSRFFEKNKQDRLTPGKSDKMRRERPKSVKSETQKGIKTNTNEIWRIIRDYFENLYSSKFENLEEMEKFPDNIHHPKLNQEDSNLTRSTT
jgi:hypothetical protein